MSNVLAIAQKELKSYFASPIAYIIIGFFALVFGWFYFVSLTFFMQASLQMGMPGQGQMNINNMAIRPLLQNVSVVALEPVASRVVIGPGRLVSNSSTHTSLVYSSVEPFRRRPPNSSRRFSSESQAAAPSACDPGPVPVGLSVVHDPGYVPE